MTKNVMLHMFLIIVPISNTMMILTLMPVATCDTNANGSGDCVTWPESNVTPHFDYFDLRNVMVPLKMLVAKYNTNPSANDIT